MNYGIPIALIACMCVVACRLITTYVYEQMDYHRNLSEKINRLNESICLGIDSLRDEHTVEPVGEPLTKRQTFDVIKLDRPHYIPYI